MSSVLGVSTLNQSRAPTRTLGAHSSGPSAERKDWDVPQPKNRGEDEWSLARMLRKWSQSSFQCFSEVSGSWVRGLYEAQSSAQSLTLDPTQRAQKPGEEMHQHNSTQCNIVTPQPQSNLAGHKNTKNAILFFPLWVYMILILSIVVVCKCVCMPHISLCRSAYV